jgi:hypothetical protein
MPKPVLHQVEALISMAISTATDSKVLPASKGGAAMAKSTSITRDPVKKPSLINTGPLSENHRLIQVPLAFDPKFQRGPLDPYGRPTRLVGQLPPLRTAPNDATRSKSLYANFGSVTPYIGSDESMTLSLLEASKRQREYAEEMEAAGRYITEDLKDTYSSLPGNLWELSDRKNTGIPAGVNEYSTPSRRTQEKDSSTELWTFQPSETSEQRGANRQHSVSFASSDTEDDNYNDKNENEDDGLHLPRISSRAGATVLESQSSSGASPTQSSPTRKSRHGTASSSRVSSSRLSRKKGHTDTETEYDRPYKCSFDGCNQAFSRVYTLKLHEKSHLMFPDYHRYRHDPMLVFDMDATRMMEDARLRLLTREELPPQVQFEVNQTMGASQKNSFIGSESYTYR